MPAGGSAERVRRRGAPRHGQDQGRAITARYQGVARFEERAAPRRAVLVANGPDARGQGTAQATVTAELEPDGDGTLVRAHTDLTLTGKVAQFGRGVLADVSANLLDQFVERLEATVLAAPDAHAPQTSPTPRTSSSG